MDNSDFRYQKAKDEIQVLTDEVVRAQNEGDFLGGIKAYQNLSNLYNEIGYYDIEGRTLYYLAKWYKFHNDTKNYELTLDKAFNCYLEAIKEADNHVLSQDNNSFFNELAMGYISIGAYNKASESALLALRIPSVGFDFEKTVGILYNIEHMKESDLDHYLYQLYGQEKIKDVKNGMIRKRNHRFYDPIEDTTIYRDAIIQIEDKIREKTIEEGEKIGSPRYYEIKKQILFQEYGIDWMIPIDLVDN